jgi:uncharacterized protein (DUF169 family)
VDAQQGGFSTTKATIYRLFHYRIPAGSLRSDGFKQQSDILGQHLRNTSLGCYGCRAISDIGEDIMFMGIPMAKMPTVIEGLQYLGKKAIPDARAKIYLPPLP